MCQYVVSHAYVQYLTTDDTPTLGILTAANVVPAGLAASIAPYDI